MDYRIDKKEGEDGIYIVSYLTTVNDVDGNPFSVVNSVEEKTIDSWEHDILALKVAIQVVEDKIERAQATKTSKASVEVVNL